MGGGGNADRNRLSLCIATSTYLLLQPGNQHSEETGKRYSVQMTSYCLVGIERSRFSL